MLELAYILAASHSGSTLLAMLLGTHKNVASVGELAPGRLGDLSTYRCSCRELFVHCSFWKGVEDAMSQRSTNFELSNFGTRFQHVSGLVTKRLLRPLHRGRILEGLRDVALSCCPSWRREYARCAGTNYKLIEVIGEMTGCRVVVDSSKSAVRLKYLLRIPGLVIKVIRLIRDGRGVALAYMNPSDFADAADPSLRGDREAERIPMVQAAHEWRRSNEEAEHVLACVGETDKMEVRYEQLCNDPDATVRRICSFLALDPGAARGDFRSVDQHIVGNGMRLDLSSEIRIDDRWGAVLSKEDLRVFGSVAGEMSRRYGYT